jgi:hypothetical protein
MKHVRLLRVAAAALACATSSTLSAQTVSPDCPPGTSTGGVPDLTRATQDACQKAIDLFQYLAPQLGTIVSGGNATLGQGGVLGGIGHFALTVRATGLSGSIPQVDQITPSVNGAVADNYATKKQFIGLPQVDASIGLFKGVPLGVTHFGGLDLIVNAAYLPSVSSGSLDVNVPDGSLKLGFGGRLGLLEESLLLPGVSVTYLRRDLPTVNIRGTSSDDSVRINGLSVKTKAWRVTASKSLMLFTLAVGGGQDKYTSEGAVSAYVAPRGGFTGGNSATVALKQDLTRTNYFANLSLNLFILKLVGEVGRVNGGTVTTYNTFDGGKADDARTYGSLGLRFGY